MLTNLGLYTQLAKSIKTLFKKLEIEIKTNITLLFLASIFTLFFLKILFDWRIHLWHFVWGFTSWVVVGWAWIFLMRGWFLMWIDALGDGRWICSLVPNLILLLIMLLTLHSVVLFMLGLVMYGWWDCLVWECLSSFELVGIILDYPLNELLHGIQCPVYSFFIS